MKIITKNKRALFDYEIIQTYEAGIKLTGTEIKSLRSGHMQINQSFAQIKNGEVFLVGSHISEFNQGNIWNHEPTRTRKLLLNKKEINYLDKQLQLKGLTLVPIKVYIKNGFAKLEIGLARGKKAYDKRHALKEKAIKRDSDRFYK